MYIRRSDSFVGGRGVCVQLLWMPCFINIQRVCCRSTAEQISKSNSWLQSPIDIWHLQGFSFWLVHSNYAFHSNFHFTSSLFTSFFQRLSLKIHLKITFSVIKIAVFVLSVPTSHSWVQNCICQLIKESSVIPWTWECSCWNIWNTSAILAFFS